MFTKVELDATKRATEVKIEEILNDDSDKYSDVEYIQNLQTLIKLKDSAENKKGF